KTPIRPKDNNDNNNEKNQFRILQINVPRNPIPKKFQIFRTNVNIILTLFNRREKFKFNFPIIFNNIFGQFKKYFI
ncbi:hypothetical protein MGG_17866, partial [Pyricularia oryzae 70-15]